MHELKPLGIDATQVQQLEKIPLSLQSSKCDFIMSCVFPFKSRK